MSRSGIALFLASLCALVAAAPALAHDSWISRGKFRSPVTGEWCCGELDCKIIPSSAVIVSAPGYVISYLGETVPHEEALPSPDGHYWRCHRPDGTRRCFFAPAVGF